MLNQRGGPRGWGQIFNSENGALGSGLVAKRPGPPPGFRAIFAKTKAEPLFFLFFGEGGKKKTPGAGPTKNQKKN